jgi:LysM repeat protein
MQVINALTTHDIESTEKLQMRGEVVQVQLVKQFIMQMGLGGIIQGLIKKIKGSEKTKPSDAEKQEKTDNYKARIAEQQTQINTLTIKNRELETTLKELQSKQKLVMISAVVAVVIALIAIIAFFISQ